MSCYSLNYANARLSLQLSPLRQYAVSLFIMRTRTVRAEMRLFALESVMGSFIL